MNAKLSAATAPTTELEFPGKRSRAVGSMRAEPPDVTELVVGEPDGVEAGADAIAAYPSELFGHRVAERIDP
jgi:hypothetical protein